MARITSGCAAMRSPSIKMALITSGCAAMRSPSIKMALITSGCCAPQLLSTRGIPCWMSNEGSDSGRGGAAAAEAAVGETVILWHPPVPLSGVSIGINRGGVPSK